MPSVRTFAKGIALLAMVGVAGWGGYEILRPAYGGSAGFTQGSAYAPIRDDNLGFHIWYPAMPGGKAITVGGNGVFYGREAGRRAPPQKGRFPLVLVSHGAGGNAGQFGWIASRLAELGFVVVLPNHPGTTTGNASAKAAVRVWERPADISAVLDEITGNPDAYPYIDVTRIAMLGFSAGGYTAMAIAGARVDPARLARFCDSTDHGMSDCAFLAHFGVDLHEMDLSPASQDLRDHRVSRAVIVDPGIVSTLTQDSLSAIDIPVHVINLGDEDKVPAGVYARPAAERIPQATYQIVPDASHFSFLAECKPAGPQILEREGELDPLCEDAGGQSRSAIHNRLVTLIAGHLSREGEPRP